MKALLSRAPGGTDTLVLGDVPDPVPGAGQLVVRVRACGINYPDFLVIQDLYQIKPPRPFAPGSEIAGEVLAVGEGVGDFRPGDRVLARTSAGGGLAEQALLRAADCVHIPDAMPFDEASALIFTFGTSYHALKQRAAIRPGETLLVLGAAGGVGIAAVQLGKAMGARVIAAASSQAKVDFAIAAGADAGVVYPQGPFDKDQRRALAGLFKDACGEHGVDVVYDGVGGDYSEAALRAIAWNGRFLVVGFPAGIAKLPLNLPLLKSAAVVGVIYGNFAVREPDVDRQNTADILDLYARGIIRPNISLRLPLERGAEAIQRLGDRTAEGKIVVMIG